MGLVRRYDGRAENAVLIPFALALVISIQISPNRRQGVIDVIGVILPGSIAIVDEVERSN